MSLTPHQRRARLAEATLTFECRACGSRIARFAAEVRRPEDRPRCLWCAAGQMAIARADRRGRTC